MGEADHRGRNGVVIGVGGQVLDECAVEFQRVDRQSLEVGQRRVACAKVVYCYPHTQLVQRQQRAGAAAIVQQNAFGDFDFQQVRGQARVLKNFAQAADEVWLAHDSFVTFPGPAARYGRLRRAAVAQVLARLSARVQTLCASQLRDKVAGRAACALKWCDGPGGLGRWQTRR